MPNLYIYKVIPNELFVNMKNHQNFVKVGHKIMLIFFVYLNVHSKINLKDESFDLRQYNI